MRCCHPPFFYSTTPYLNPGRRRTPDARWIQESPFVDGEGWPQDSNRPKENGNSLRRERPTSRTNSTPNSELMAINRPSTTRYKVCTDLSPICTDLPPNTITPLLFVVERRTTPRSKAYRLADAKSTRSTVSEQPRQRYQYSNPA